MYPFLRPTVVVARQRYLEEMMCTCTKQLVCGLWVPVSQCWLAYSLVVQVYITACLYEFVCRLSMIGEVKNTLIKASFILYYT